MAGLKAILRRSRLARRLTSLFRFLSNETWFAGWVWIAPRKFMDGSHLRRSWDFEHPDARRWHGRVLSMIAGQIGGEQWGDALEIGCSEGVFTSYLASRCRSVDAYDISPIARQRAAERCAQYPNVRIGLLNVADDEIHGQYDVVFAMDILSCIRGRKRVARAVSELSRAIRNGGLLIYTDNSMPLDILQTWGHHPWWSSILAIMEPDDCVRLLASQCGLQLVSREQYRENPEGGRDQLIAIMQKGFRRSPSRGVGSFENQ